MSGKIKNKAITETALSALAAVMFAAALLLLFLSDSKSRFTPEGLSKLDINAAELTQLELIEGIGPVTAASIIEYREEISPSRAFKDTDELLNVKGIGDVKSRAIAEIIYFDTTNKHK